MSWSNYGFTTQDMALKPIDKPLQSVIMAFKERLDAIGVSGYDSLVNGTYDFWPDADTTRQHASRYDLIEEMAGKARLSGMSGVFVDSNASDSLVYPYYTSRYNMDALLDKAVAMLADRGFITTKIPSGLSHELLMQDKNWLIQRKTLADLFRYYTKETTFAWESNNALWCTYRQTPRIDYNPIYQPTVEDVFNNLGPSIFSIISAGFIGDLYLVHIRKSSSGYYSDYLLGDVFIQKAFADAAISETGDSTIRCDFSHDGYFNFDLFGSGGHLYPTIDTSTVISNSYGDFYKVNFPYSENDLINAVIDNTTQLESTGILSAGADAAPSLVHIIDGLEIFDFLDT